MGSSENKNWTGERLETGVFTETTVEHLHRYALAMEFVPNKKVLDIACGEGYGSHLLAGKASHVTGVDINKEVISQASAKYQKPNLAFIAGSAEDIPAGGKQFDIVVSFETLEHIANHDKMMEEIKRVLQPGGLLIISTPDKKNYSDKTGYQNPFHLKELYPEEFTALLKNHFNHVQVLNQQTAVSSVISSPGTDGLNTYKGDYRAISTDTGEDRLYCIALASDNPLPPVKNSVFNGQSIFAEALTAREQLVMQTITYKLGHALLYPAKLIKKLFNKKDPAA